MKARLTRWMGWVAMITALVLAGASASADSYFSLTKPWWPPLPFAPNGILPENVTEAEPGRFVYDDSEESLEMSREAAPLGRGGMMEMNNLNPWDPGYTNTNDPPAYDPDTNSWIGTWILGMPATPDFSRDNIEYAEPAIWTIMCTNAAYDQHIHSKYAWYTMTKVCPGDLVWTYWPQSCATNPPGWNSFLIIQQGTNSSGTHCTNYRYASMNDEYGTQGNIAAWKIPNFPSWGEPWVMTNTGCFTNMGPPIWCQLADSGSTNAQPTNEWPSMPTNWVPCPKNPGGWEPPVDIPILGPFTDPPIWMQPTVTPIIVLPKKNPVEWPPVTPVPIQHDPNCSYFELPEAKPYPFQPPWMPELPAPIIPYFPFCNIPFTEDTGQLQTSTNLDAWATNTVATISFLLHGMPNYTYEIISTTNMVDWVREGTTNVTLDESGRLGVMFWTTNFTVLQPTMKFYGARLVQ